MGEKLRYCVFVAYVTYMMRNNKHESKRQVGKW